MMQLHFKIAIAVIITYFATNIQSKHYRITENFFREIFKEFQTEFDKHYKNETDAKRGYDNFVKNFIKILELNGVLAAKKNNTRLYVVNKYADEDPDGFDAHYGFKLKPYDEKTHADIEKQALRNRVPDNQAISIEDAQLFDLQIADQIYEHYLEVFNKTKPASETEYTIRYYRLVKTLAEINKNNMDGKPLRTLDDQADIVKKPREYFE